MSLTWRKIWRDLTLPANRGRTVLAVLSVAVGVFALGVIYGAQGVITHHLAIVNELQVPEEIAVWTWPVDQATQETVAAEPGVAVAERLVATGFLWKLEGEENWRDGELIGRVDFEDQHINLMQLVDGRWPDKRTLAMEKQTASYFNLTLGSEILIYSGKEVRRISVVGIVHDYEADPPQSGNEPVFYATPETIEWLVGASYNRIHVRMENWSWEEAQALCGRLEARLNRAGYQQATAVARRDPTVHWFQDDVDTMALILTVLGSLALAMSAFLIVNTMTALIAQQVWQIGVMKVLGAKFGRVLRVYLTVSLIYGGLALLVAVPLGAAGGHWLAKYVLEDHANIFVETFRVSPKALSIQLVVGLVVPLLAGLVPVLNGARISPHQAISSYGLGGRFGQGWLDRIIGRLRFLARPLALSLRNTFRRKARVVLTLTALTLGGLMFIMTMTLADSFSYSINQFLNDFGDDINVGFSRPYRSDQLIEVAKSVPGVVHAEVWQVEGGLIKLDEGLEPYMTIWGTPADTQIFNPRVVVGRNLLPEDDHAILLNYRFAMEYGIEVGDELRFDLRERETTWTVVGLLLFASDSDSFVPLETLAREISRVGRGTRINVVAEQHDPDYQQAVIADLRQSYEAQGIETTWSWTSSQMEAEQWEDFGIILYLILAMALLAAVVGAVGLMSTMSINVVERRREIGVMRAIGAKSAAIARIFVGEGLMLGVLSWLITLPLSYPCSRLFCDVVGLEMMDYQLDFAFSVGGVLLWLLIAVVLATAASWIPAKQATQLSVWETLAYE